MTNVNFFQLKKATTKLVIAFQNVHLFHVGLNLHLTD